MGAPEGHILGAASDRTYSLIHEAVHAFGESSWLDGVNEVTSINRGDVTVAKHARQVGDLVLWNRTVWAAGDD